jgi:hypothetical protein
MGQKVIKKGKRGGEETLPPAGDARKEELKLRADELAEEAERVMNELETFGIDPSKLDSTKVEREVRQAVNDDGEVFVENANPDYAYCWMFRDPQNRFGGRFVNALKVLGWEVVAGDNMKEAWRHRSVTGERWIADCLLMRCRREVYEQIKLKDRERRLRQQESITGQLKEKGARYGMRVHTELNDHLRSLAGVREQEIMRPLHVPSTKALRQEWARKSAQEILDQKLRSGTLEGLDVPGSRR